MKKIVAFMAAVLMFCLSLCSCSDTDIKTSDNTSITSQSPFSPNSEQTSIEDDSNFLKLISEETPKKVIGIDYLEEYNFESASLYGLDYLPAENTDSDLKDVIITPFDENEEYVYDHTELKKEMTVRGTEYNDRFNAYDVYTIIENSSSMYDGVVGYQRGTDILCLYRINVDNDKELNVPSDNEAKQMADDFLMTIYSEKELSKYTFTNVEALDEQKPNKCSKRVNYVRYVCGYPTDEKISVSIHDTGVFVSYLNYCRGMYDNLPEGLTKERIDRTVQKLKDEVASMGIEGTITYGDTQLTASLSGELYVKMKITITKNEYEEKDSETIFMSI
ncbi:MAG: YcdB/YcdC domain-containing protein [Acutalibacteraceae bacterium]